MKSRPSISLCRWDLFLACLVRLRIFVDPVIQPLSVPCNLDGVELHARHFPNVSCSDKLSKRPALSVWTAFTLPRLCAARTDSFLRTPITKPVGSGLQKRVYPHT